MTVVNGTILAVGLSASGPIANRIDGTYMLAGVNSAGQPQIITLNDDGTIPVNPTDFPAQATNTVFAGPTSGVSAVPTFRALVAGDIPSGIANVAYTNVANVFSATQQLGSANVLKWSIDNGISRLGAASLAIGNGTAGDFSGALSLTTLVIGTNPALAGAIRLANNTAIYSRNATNDGNMRTLLRDNSDDIYLGESNSGGSTYIDVQTGKFITMRVNGASGLTVGSNLFTNFYSAAVLASFTVATLPSASTAGATAFVTDSTLGISAGLGLTVVGGGSNKVPVFSDGSNWKIG